MFKGDLFLLRTWKEKILSIWFKTPISSNADVQHCVQSDTNSPQINDKMERLQEYSLTKEQLLKNVFPLKRGMRIVHENGSVFQIYQQEFRGAITKIDIYMRLIHNYNNQTRPQLREIIREEAKKWEQYTFESMDELEMFCWENRHRIQDIINADAIKKFGAR